MNSQPPLLRYSELETADELRFVSRRIADLLSSIGSYETKLRRVRNAASQADCAYRIEYARWQIANLQDAVVALATDEDVSFVRVAGLALKGQVCTKCGEKIENGNAPVTVTRKSGSWCVEDVICYDAKYTNAVPWARCAAG